MEIVASLRYPGIHHVHAHDILSINTPLHFESAQNYTDSGEITRGANAPSVISPKIKMSCSKFVERSPIGPR